MIYTSILNKIKSKKIIFLLIDPDKYTQASLTNVVQIANECQIDCILVGGSIVSNPVDVTVKHIKELTSIPVVLFPGNLLQISDKADGIFLLSLISGRNPEFLIGNHVIAAPMLKNSGLEIIPTGYILIDGGNMTSVEYMSNTKPIPASKTDIAVSTAMAGEMTGNKLIYLEAGSGAINTVPTGLIKEVKKNITIPLIVGGGIKSKAQALEIFHAGADIIVVGNIIETNPNMLIELAQ